MKKFTYLFLMLMFALFTLGESYIYAQKSGNNNRSNRSRPYRYMKGRFISVYKCVDSIVVNQDCFFFSRHSLDSTVVYTERDYHSFHIDDECPQVRTGKLDSYFIIDVIDKIRKGHVCAYCSMSRCYFPALIDTIYKRSSKRH